MSARQLRPTHELVAGYLGMALAQLQVREPLSRIRDGVVEALGELRPPIEHIGERELTRENVPAIVADLRRRFEFERSFVGLNSRALPIFLVRYLCSIEMARRWSGAAPERERDTPSLWSRLKDALTRRRRMSGEEPANVGGEEEDVDEPPSPETIELDRALRDLGVDCDAALVTQFLDIQDLAYKVYRFKEEMGTLPTPPQRIGIIAPPFDSMMRVVIMLDELIELARWRAGVDLSPPSIWELPRPNCVVAYQPRHEKWARELHDHLFLHGADVALVKSNNASEQIGTESRDKLIVLKSERPSLFVASALRHIAEHGGDEGPNAILASLGPIDTEPPGDSDKAAPHPWDIFDERSGRNVGRELLESLAVDFSADEDEAFNALWSALKEGSGGRPSIDPRYGALR